MEEHLEREAKTLEAMGEIYCKAHHVGAAQAEGHKLCCECAAVLDYAIERSKRCPQERKCNCEDCHIHCYKLQMRQRIRAIMCYAGPRMMWKHPVMALRHMRKKFNARNR